VILVHVREHDALDLLDAPADAVQTVLERLEALGQPRPRVDERERVFVDELDVDGPEVQARRDGELVDTHDRDQGSGVRSQV
jgi:hypothetical protein